MCVSSGQAVHESAATFFGGQPEHVCVCCSPVLLLISLCRMLAKEGAKIPHDACFHIRHRPLVARCPALGFVFTVMKIALTRRIIDVKSFFFAGGTCRVTVLCGKREGPNPSHLSKNMECAIQLRQLCVSGALIFTKIPCRTLSMWIALYCMPS